MRDKKEREEGKKQTKDGGSSNHWGLGPLSFILGDTEQIPFALLGSLVHATAQNKKG